MRFLLDQNLSFRLCERLADLFPNSTHVRTLGLDQADDQAIWRHARTAGYALVTLDADFSEMAALHGAPPKVVWLRCGNQSTATIEELLRRNADAITGFAGDAQAACLEVY